MESLKEIMLSHKGRSFDKIAHYVGVYERHLEKYRGQKINFLEIGVQNGGSMQLWKKYFGDGANIFGLDIDPRCKEFEEENVQIFIGDQSDKKFMLDLIEKLPALDVIIDDGGHTMDQQITTFDVMYPHLKFGGTFICEDCVTSYMPEFGGGPNAKITFIDYMKEKIDSMNHLFFGNLPDTSVGATTYGMHFYNSFVVLEKERMRKDEMLIMMHDNKNQAIRKL